MADALHDALLRTTASGAVDAALRLAIQNLAARPSDGLLRRAVARTALGAGRSEDAVVIGSVAFAADLAGGSLLGALASLAIVREAGGDPSPMWSTLSQTIGRTGFSRVPRPSTVPPEPLLDTDYPALAGDPLLAAASSLAARPVDLPPVAFAPVAWLGYLSNDAIRWALPRLRVTCDGASVPADAACWIASGGGDLLVGTCIVNGATSLDVPAELAWLSADDSAALAALPGSRMARDTAFGAARVATAVAQAPILSTLAPQAVRLLLAGAARSRVAPGVLADAGRPFRGIALVTEGRLSLLRDDGETFTVVDSLGPGGVFGEWTFAGDDAGRWQVVAREDSEVVWIDPARAHAALESHAGALDALVALSAMRSTQA